MNAKIGADTNAINWFEIPVTDIDRATKFYEHILDVQLNKGDFNGMKMNSFPSDPMQGKIGGALVQSPMHHPSATGAVIYLNGNPNLQHIVDRIEQAGGKVQMPKTHITDEIGYMAFFTDTEGNSVALHSNG